MLPRRLGIIIALVLASCTSKPAPQTTDSKTKAAAPTPVAAQPSPTPPAAPTGVAEAARNVTGPLSEEAFKALHELNTTSPPPRRGEMVTVAGNRAYLSLPQGAQAPLPGVVVIHEWWGLNEHIQHWADRLASDGYAALAVDLYGGKVATTPDQAMQYIKAVDQDQASQILRSAFAFLGTEPRIQASKRASIGWCFGGHWSLRMALDIPDLDAAVIYYGRLVTDPQALKAIKADVLGIFGTRDQGIPLAQVDAFEAGLKSAGIKATVFRYDADHAFANPSGKRYDATAAGAAWTQVQTFLRTQLKGS